MRVSAVMLMLAFSAFSVPAVATVSPPQVGIKVINDLPTPLPFPFDRQADAHANVEAAFARAQHSGKRVLIHLGGNWCADCRILVAVMDLPEVKAFVERHYEVVAVDVGHFDRNLDIARRFGLERIVDVPTIIIANPDGKLVNIGDASEMSDARHMTPQGIADWLARWAGPGAHE
jgi:thiol-disulfide isomerase/thioredoxin